VKIVLDECLDLRLRHQFPEHECVTVQYLKARGAPDGPLLALVANTYDVLITRDSKMRYQQNSKLYPRLAVLYLTSGDGSIEETLPFVSLIRDALRKIKPGQHMQVP
jgi:predicted nuclease of predicted toxin-antitoxin system